MPNEAALASDALPEEKLIGQYLEKPADAVIGKDLENVWLSPEEREFLKQRPEARRMVIINAEREAKQQTEAANADAAEDTDTLQLPPELTEQRDAAAGTKAAQTFIENTPDYKVTPDNAQRLLATLQANGLSVTQDNLGRAWRLLKREGLVEVNAVRANASNASNASASETKRGTFSSGLSDRTQARMTPTEGNGIDEAEFLKKSPAERRAILRQLRQGQRIAREWVD